MVEGCYVKMTQLIFSSSSWYRLGKGGDSSEVGEDVTRDKGKEEEWPNVPQMVTAAFVRQQHLCWSSANKWAKSRAQDLKGMLGRNAHCSSCPIKRGEVVLGFL